MTKQFAATVMTQCPGLCVSGRTSGSETPAPLKGLQRFLEVEQLERRFEAERFLRHGGTFALLGGETLLVNLRVGPLELRRMTHSERRPAHP